MPLKSFSPVVPLDVGTENGGVICSALGTAKQAPTFIKHLLYAQKGPLPPPSETGAILPTSQMQSRGTGPGQVPPATP